MKIGMILDDKYPPHPRVKNEAINLIEAGHVVVLFCLNYTNLPKRETIDGIEIVRYKANKWLRRFTALAYSIFVYRWVLQIKLKKFIAEYNPDALHVHNMRIGKAVLKATKHFEGEIVLDLHENIPEIMKMYHHVTHFPGNVLIYPSIWKKWEKRLVKKTDKIVVVTDEAKADLIDNYETPDEKIIVIPNSVQPSFYTSPRINAELINRFKDKFSMFYFGDTGIRRGLETAIRSVVQLKKEIPEIHLIIVGKSKSDNYLNDLISKLGIEKYVSHDGFQDEAMLQSYITASSVCISPLLRNIHHDTTFANKIFQYMAMGKPQVVSDCPAQQRIIDEARSGLIHEADNVEDFSEKILTLYNDKKLSEKLGENGATFIREKYNQQLMSVGLMEYYNSL